MAQGSKNVAWPILSLFAACCLMVLSQNGWVALLLLLAWWVGFVLWYAFYFSK